MPTRQQEAKEKAIALRLQQAAKVAIGQLRPAENTLLDKVPRSSGDWALAGPSDDDVDNNAVTNGEKWQHDREIRSELLRWLCVDEYARKQVDPHGLSVKGAKIIGSLDPSYVTVPFRLLLQQCYFESRLNLFQSQVPELILNGSRVPGINAGNSTIKGDVWLGDGFRCDGEVNLVLTHIAGDLDCSGGTFYNRHRKTSDTGEWDPSSGTALNADGATVDGFVLLRRQQGSERTFQSEGEVRFLGAQVREDLDCEGGRFSNLPQKAFPSSAAINAERVIVKGGIFMRNGFYARGGVRMHDAQVGSTFECGGGTFSNPLQQGEKIGGDALILDRAVVKGTAFFGLTENEKEPSFSADGNVSLVATFIGGPLDMKDGNFTKADLDLSGAIAASIFDSGEKSWPAGEHLHLRLFQYGDIDPKEGRLKWLARQPDDDFNTGSYVQLAKVLKQSGNDDYATLVLQTAEKLQTRHGHRYWYLRPDNWFLASIGYGYRPIWAAGYISIMSALGWIIYRRGYLAGTMVPAEKDAYNELKSNHCLPPSYLRFAPLILSLENSLPLVKLGQADKWQPDTETSSHATPSSNGKPPVPSSLIDSSSSAGASGDIKVAAAELGTTDLGSVAKVTEPPPLANQPIAQSLPPLFVSIRRRVRSLLCAVGLQPDASGQTPTSPLSRGGTSATFLKWFIWIQILLGWLFATLFVAGYSGIVRK